MKSFLKAAVLILALAAYAFASHLLFMHVERYARVAVMWIWTPLAVAGALMAWRSGARWTALVALLAATILIWLWSADANTHPGLLFMIQYLAMQIGLGGLFGFTLIGARVPLVTRFARIVHGTLPPEIERYTRRVTLVWTLFFVLMGSIATALYFGSSTAHWSVFVNLLTPLFLGVMFVGEYFVRRLSFPDFPHSSLMTGFRAFQRAFDEHKSN